MVKIAPVLNTSDPGFTGWYSRLPAGLPIIDINGEHELFKPGETDDDMRYGMLAFGFLRKA